MAHRGVSNAASFTIHESRHSAVLTAPCDTRFGSERCIAGRTARDAIPLSPFMCNNAVQNGIGNSLVLSSLTQRQYVSDFSLASTPSPLSPVNHSKWLSGSTPSAVNPRPKWRPVSRVTCRLVGCRWKGVMPKGGYPTSLARGAVSRLRSQPLPRFYSHLSHLASDLSPFIIHVFY